MVRAGWLLGVLSLVAVSVVAEARVSGTVPLVIRLEGHRGAALPGDRGIADLTFRHGEETIAFRVREIWVLAGDAAGVDVLHEVEPYTPSMSIDGPPAVLERLLAAKPDQMLELTGYFRRGQRILMLSGVEPKKSPPAP